MKQFIESLDWGSHVCIPVNVYIFFFIIFIKNIINLEKLNKFHPLHDPEKYQLFSSNTVFKIVECPLRSEHNILQRTYKFDFKDS